LPLEGMSTPDCAELRRTGELKSANSKSSAITLR